MMKDVLRLSMIDQAKLIKKGEISPAELLEESIQQIEKVNPKINAVVLPMFDLAREAVSGLSGKEVFSGVPMLLKDVLAEYAGAPMTEGSRFLQGYLSPRDSELVRRYKAAGFIICGRTNSPEFASMPTTEPELYGPTRNPWDLTRSPGGSSGGSGAAVAAGMVSVAHANDGGGSTRVPASACGLVGLKGTRGRNPMGPDYGEIGAAGLLSEHVVTRTVADNAAMLDVTAGADRGAPFGAPAQNGSFLEQVHKRPRKLKIAFSDQPVLPTPVHPDCSAAVKEIALLCSELGHEVEEAKPKVSADHFNSFFTTIWLAMVAWMIRDWERRTGRKAEEKYFEKHTWKMFKLDQERRPSDLLLAIHDMHQFGREVAPFFEEYDVWLTPTLTEPPPLLGHFKYDPAHPRQSTERLEQFPRFTSFANVTGQPAISLPLCRNANGLPIGIQLIGAYADEATILRLAGQLEEAKPWAHLWPEI